jgi:hypothetical protein
MYHALRAVCYFDHGGDDNEAHLKLPGALPATFPNRAYWENELKSARFDRNRADYDPYPTNDRAFEPVALSHIQEAVALGPIAINYLRSRGCDL